MDGDEPSRLEVFQSKLRRTTQIWMDWSTPHIAARWIFFVVLMGFYMLRVFTIDGWYIITYGLGIYLLNNFIGFLSPQIDPDQEGPGLPMSDSEEFRPFSRRLPEFKFWAGSARAVCTAFFMTFFEVFNIPVFWPILLLYFIALFFLTMKRQILHMYKHRYVPWSWGKAKYKGKAPPKEDK
mmetsp:Transcript_54733/g.108624  ORF Transcript_54733/g.108624 Transcript_54733/m.108624 type:complete len:181 (+) Transcript_54733:114-656(+)|eukprot:CAMPEP_0171610122 /NCGR_PEP_ID=MMETSP0990-20121206/9867_1 /TAXON_ID=483369 /ORGANISM="non described non described, Strain CCMP2098" /LENGTH=180 /DNA_ID=CAMNT_0012173483 /DNA_START=102 /DNA_END=644 /DNA_ORIENTATION=-